MNEPNKWERLFFEYIEFVDCTLCKVSDCQYGLKDNMSTNFANMENEIYSNAFEIAEKLSYFENDYIFSDLCEDLEKVNIGYLHDFKQPQLILSYRHFLPNQSWKFDIIDMLYNHLDDINLNKIAA